MASQPETGWTAERESWRNESYELTQILFLKLHAAQRHIDVLYGIIEEKDSEIECLLREL